MKITKSTLQRVIQEELRAVLREGAIPLDVKRTKTPAGEVRGGRRGLDTDPRR